MPRPTGASKLKNSGAAAYWGYKAFQALRVCSGDVTVIAEMGAELLAEGLLAGSVANPEMVVEAIESMINLRGGVKNFRRSVKNFSQFSAALTAQLRLTGDKSDGDTMESAERIYKMFMECDLDNSGGVSLEEYVNFCGREGVPREMAEPMFFQADKDGNGQISFEEWAAMMVGRIGRDQNSFNCGGLHGLTQYNVPINGLACDFCEKPIPAGSLAFGCRRCNCDSCASCGGLPHGAPPSLPPRHTGRPPPPPPPTESNDHFNCRERHGLTPFIVPTVAHCDWCHAIVHAGHTAVGCRACDVDGCMTCVTTSLASNNESAITCPGRHGLIPTLAEVHGYVCDFCHAGVPYGSTMFTCRTCQLDCCAACIWKDHCRARSTGGAFVCRGNHAFQTLHIMSYQQLAHRCDWCRGAPSLGERILRCDICDVDLCNACLASGSTRAAAAAAAAAAKAAPPPAPVPPPASAPPSEPRRPPPPSYYDLESTDDGPSLPPPSGKPPLSHGNTGAPPARGPKPAAPGMSPVEYPFRLDSVVRVVGVDDEEIDGKLMTVLGFEPNDGSYAASDGGMVVLNRRGRVFRIPEICVVRLME